MACEQEQELVNTLETQLAALIPQLVTLVTQINTVSSQLNIAKATLAYCLLENQNPPNPQGM